MLHSIFPAYSVQRFFKFSVSIIVSMETGRQGVLMRVIVKPSSPLSLFLSRYLFLSFYFFLVSGQ